MEAPSTSTMTPARTQMQQALSYQWGNGVQAAPSPTPNTAQTAAGGLGSLVNPIGMIAGATVNGLFNLGSSFVNAQAQRDVANTNASVANRQLDFVQKDYDIAKDMGLYHPSQLTSLTGGAQTNGVYKLSGRGLSYMPRTTGKSPFSI